MTAAETDIRLSSQQLSLDSLVTTHRDDNGDTAALEFDGQVCSYAQLAAAISLLSRRIAACGNPGDRVAVLARNRFEYVVLLYAVPAAGRVVVPLNIRLAPREWMDQLERSGASILVAEPDLLEALSVADPAHSGYKVICLGEDYQDWLTQGPGQSPPKLLGDEPAWLMFTSGTTGKPKGAILTHRSLLAGLESAQQGRPVLAEDRFLYCFPLFHVSAHNVLLQHRYGATVMLLPGFNAEQVLLACRSGKVTTLSLAPTMLAMLLEHPEFRPSDLAGIRTLGYGASAMPIDLLRRTAEMAPIGFSGGYGMTELSGSISFLDADAHRQALAGESGLLASVGKPVSGVEVRLLDDDGGVAETSGTGEILVRGTQVMKEYWNDSVATAGTLDRGWLHTGDIGHMDAAGNLYIVDRKKDMILSGGENVASREVEEVLAMHESISTAAVVGLPDDLWGEKVCAVVTLKPGLRVDTSDLQVFCRERLAGYKIPKSIAVVETMPVNANGKIDKGRVREQLVVHLDPGGSSSE